MLSESVVDKTFGPIPGAKFWDDEKKQRFLKANLERKGIDPANAYWDGDMIKVKTPVAKKVAAPKPKIGKPEGMSDAEYINRFAPEHNEKLAKKISEVEGEDWKPVQNIGRYFGGAVDFSCDYSVSNKGRLKVVNFKDVNKSDIYTGYPAPTRGAMQFHLNGFDEEGNSMKTCPDVKYIVADAWLEPHDMKQFMVIHKDGDYKNNNVENLEWVPRKRK